MCEFLVSLVEKTACCKFGRCTFLVSVDMPVGYSPDNSGGAAAAGDAGAAVVVANSWTLLDR